jgi:hypothetical protein
MDRLRASKLLPVWLLLLALASALAGFHAVSHVLDADHGAFSAPLSQGDSGDDGAPKHRFECPGCRLVGAWSLALAPGASWLPLAAPGHDLPAARRTSRWVADPVARWQQQLKHGPPQLPR